LSLRLRLLGLTGYVEDGLIGESADRLVRAERMLTTSAPNYRVHSSSRGTRVVLRFPVTL
jgi:hypothetical protein